MSCFSIHLQQVSSFRRVPFIKEVIYFRIMSLVFKTEIEYLKTEAMKAIHLHIKYFPRLPKSQDKSFNQETKSFRLKKLSQTQDVVLKGTVVVNKLLEITYSEENCPTTWSKATLARITYSKYNHGKNICRLFHISTISTHNK